MGEEEGSRQMRAGSIRTSLYVVAPGSLRTQAPARRSLTDTADRTQPSILSGWVLRTDFCVSSSQGIVFFYFKKVRFALYPIYGKACKAVRGRDGGVCHCETESTSLLSQHAVA
jgi:hypothetical protein